MAPCNAAWRELSVYLAAHWNEITRRGNVDLTKAFKRYTAEQAVDVHLYFVKLLGCELVSQNVAIDVKSFSAALIDRTPHPEVTVLMASCAAQPGKLMSYSSEVSLLKSGSEVQSALWAYLVSPMAFKICYLKADVPVREPDGFPWHPARQRKIVKLSPYKGDTQPLVARRDLRI